MKRALILCLFLAAGAGSGFYDAGFCDSVYFPPLQPMNSNGITSQPTPTQPRNSITSRPDPYAQNPNTAQSYDYDDPDNADYQAQNQGYYPNNRNKSAYTPNPNVSYPRIDEVERSLFKKSYPNQDITFRLARIEQTLFKTTYPNMALSQRLDNITANYSGNNSYAGIPSNSLAKMEVKVFNRTYVKSSTQNRIERLEQKLFGAVQSGDLNTRYETLASAVRNYNANQFQDDGYPAPLASTQGRWKGVVGSLGNMLRGGGGVLTGFTPSIDPFYNTGYGSYNNVYNGYNGYGYNNNYFNRYNGGRFANMANPYMNMNNGLNRGYGRTGRGYYEGTSNDSYGTGMGVTILD